MMIKAIKVLEGVLIRPLAIGSSALFLNGGGMVRTSRVVAIHGPIEDGVCFETLNTRYHLLTGPTYGPAAEQRSMAMAA